MPALRPAVLAIAALLSLPAAASAAGTWNPDSYLANGLQEASGPSIAVAADGGAVGGWQQNQPPFGNVDAVLTARAPGTGPFATGGTPQGVASAHAHDLGDMHMTTAVNSSGKAVVAWVQAAFDKHFRVQAAVRAAGASSFGPVQTLTAEDEDAALPAVAINDAGAAVLVWRRHDTATESWQVQGAWLSAAGTQLSPLGDISDEPDDDFDDPFASLVSVAIAPSGDAVVAWESTGEHRVDEARWARVGGGGVHDLGAGTHFADVAAGADGSFAMTWATGSGGTGADASLARATTGGFGAAVPVGTTDGAFASTRVALDGAGNAIVALTGTQEQTLNAPTRVAVTSCAALCDELEWLSADSDRAQGLDLAVNAAGDAVAAWSRSDGETELIEASLRAHGHDWDAPVFISRDKQAAHLPTLGIDGGGNVTVAWTAANVALAAVRQTTGAVEGATGPTDPGPTDPGPTDPGPGTPPSPPPPGDTALAASVKQAKNLTASAKGAFKGPKVSCSEPAGGNCRVTVTFKAKRLVAASKTLTVAAGKSATPTLKLRKKAKKRLAKKGKLALKGTVVVRDAAGNARTFSVKATLKAKKRR